MYITTDDLSRKPGLGAFNWRPLLSLLSMNIDLPGLGPIQPGIYFGMSDSTPGPTPKARLDDWIFAVTTIAIPFLGATLLAVHIPRQMRIKYRLIRRRAPAKRR